MLPRTHFVDSLEIFSLDMAPYSRRHLQHDSMLFFPLALVLGYAQKSIFRFQYFLAFVFFSFPYLFAVVIDLPLNLLPFWESIIETGNFRHGLATCILLWVFQSNFWAFSYIFQAPLSWSLWYGYHWKDLQFSSCRTWV